MKQSSTVSLYQESDKVLRNLVIWTTESLESHQVNLANSDNWVKNRINLYDCFTLFKQNKVNKLKLNKD